MTAWAGQVRIFREARAAVANAKLAEYRKQTWLLANFTRQGIVQKQAAVDLLHELAIGHALVRSLGEDRVTAIIGEAFATDLVAAEEVA